MALIECGFRRDDGLHERGRQPLFPRDLTDQPVVVEAGRRDVYTRAQLRLPTVRGEARISPRDIREMGDAGFIRVAVDLTPGARRHSGRQASERGPEAQREAHAGTRSARTDSSRFIPMGTCLDSSATDKIEDSHPIGYRCAGDSP